MQCPRCEPIYRNQLRRVFAQPLLLICLLILFSPLSASAQTTKKVVVIKETRIKLKLARKLVSSRIRIGDYIPFVVAEDILIWDEPAGEWRMAVKAATPVFGKVVDRKRRILFFRPGKFGVSLDEVRGVDGTSIPVFITRSNEPRTCRDKTTGESYSAENKNKRIPCIRGRTYFGSFTSALPSAIAATITTAALVLVKDSAARTAAAVTLAGQVASQPGLATILNGVDAEMDDGEIFEAEVVKGTTIVVPVTPGVNKDVEKVGRFLLTPEGYVVNPTPEGYIITDYFSDLVKYPSPPGPKKIFTGKVIERYVDKLPGTKMNMCQGEKLPQGWRVIDSPVNPNICPREPGDDTAGPTYSVIQKLP